MMHHSGGSQISKHTAKIGQNLFCLGVAVGSGWIYQTNAIQSSRVIHLLADRIRLNGFKKINKILID